LEALDRTERDDFYAEVREAQTAELREHQIDMLAAYEKHRG
jgi:hypothetical protein